MFRSITARLIVGFAAIFFVASIPAAAALIVMADVEPAKGYLLSIAGAYLVSLGIGAAAAFVVVRFIGRPLGFFAHDLKMLAEEAKTLDKIATAQNKLDANIEAMRKLLYGRGDPTISGQMLCFGDFVVNGNNDIVDQVQATHGGAATVFLGDLRITTNIKDEAGKRLVGTRLAAGPAYESVLKHGKSYRGEATIFGQVYITIYEPIMVNQDVVGIIFVAVKKADAIEGGAASALPAGGPISQLVADLRELRAVTVEKAVVMREALDQRYVLSDARRKTEAVDRAAASVQRTMVEALSMALEKLAGADLTHHIDVVFPGEYKKIKDDFGVALAALRETMRAIMGETRSMRGHSTEIAQAVDELSRRTEQQAASLEETAAALDQITKTVSRTADGVENARKVAGGAKSDAEHSTDIVRQAVHAMSAIEKSSKQINQIISVIDEIALQTNLLALNAGVEAARAGDAGKGFAVVATEVRALAQRSAEAAKEIKGLISASANQVTHGVNLVAETGRSLERILAQVADVDSIVADIAASAQEQSQSLQEVNAAITHMDQVTQQNAAMVEESTAASHHLAQEAGKLEELVSQFRTGSADETVASLDNARSKRAGGVPRPMMKTVASRSVSHASGAKTAAARQADAAKDWEEF